MASMARRWSRHFVYGLALRSEWQLPCPPDTSAFPPLAESELRRAAPADFARYAARLALRPNGGGWFCRLRLEDGADYLRWRELFEFHVSADGRRITGRPHEGASTESFTTYLLGQVLALALVKQGLEPLHAAVVAVDGRAVGFVARSGLGKSSLAAAFLAGGHRLLTDDILVAAPDGKGEMVHPGPPRIKLYPESARMLFEEPLLGSPMVPGIAKRVLPLDPSRLQATPLRLAALYALNEPEEIADGSEVRIRPLSAREAFLRLAQNTLIAQDIGPDRLKRQFEFAHRLATAVPVRELAYPRRLDCLPAVRDAVLADLRR